jgi:hypothetical protein
MKGFLAFQEHRHAPGMNLYRWKQGVRLGAALADRLNQT